MNLLTLSFACGLIIVANVTHAASDFTLQNKAAGYNIPLAVTTTVEKHTANYHIFSEKINMTARVGDVATYPEQVLQLVNKERAKVGARPLRLNDELVAGAKIRAEEISRHMSHDRPDGSSCFTVLRNRNRSLGENIAAGRATPEAVVDQWMHSPGHRANMLSKDFSELGVGYYYKDNSSYKHYWIQMFRG